MYGIVMFSFLIHEINLQITVYHSLNPLCLILLLAKKTASTKKATASLMLGCDYSVHISWKETETQAEFFFFFNGKARERDSHM
jgi:hypothetical protein